MELTVNSSGWIALGFSPKGGMSGADLVIGGVSATGNYFKDYHAVGNSMPVVDQKQNFKLLSLSESDGKTVMRFQRSIDSCDENDFTITTLPTKIIYAYGQTDDITYHGARRGTKELNLLKYMPRTDQTTSSYFDMTMINFTVPANQTYYYCKIMKAPAFDRKQHIYRIEPLIRNIDLVHHLLLYRCPPTITQPFEDECYSGRDDECMETVAVWGVGGGAFEFPEVAGLPIGGTISEFFYRLEVHYNNLNETTGRVDNSGLRFYYTSTLRQHDAAVLMTGLAVGPWYAIPPKAKAFHTYGMCDTAQIREVLETPQNLQVFSVMLHTHLAGRKVRVGHFRGGNQIDLLAEDENYNFNYQEDDKLLVECTYNTEKRDTLTWGGLSTSEEMCLAFLFYYPAMNLSTCVSFPDLTTLWTEMGTSDETSWYNMVSRMTWNDTSIDEYQRTLKRIDQLLMVTDSFNNGSYKTGTVPDLTVAPPVSCKNTADVIQAEMCVCSLVLLLFFPVHGTWGEQDPLLPFSEPLDPQLNVRLRWGFDEIQQSLLMELTVNSSGWIALGFSPKGGMSGADLVIGGVSATGNYFKDYHAVGNSMPVLDQKQNYKLLSLSESDGKTVMRFQRSIDSCDENDLPITNLPMKLIYAYGQTDDITYHGSTRGTKELNLLKYMPRVNLPNSTYFDLTVVNFTVPALQTYYHCKIMKSPTFARKQHIYRIEPLIRNIDLVHHLLLYRCPPTAFEFPEVAGLPIGGNTGDFFYRLEVHYNNPNITAGRVDNSGLRFYYTSDLRQNDAAILSTGLVVAAGYAIPPKAKSFLTYGMCDTSYIPQVLEKPQDLQVFSVMLHTHLAGRKVRVGHFRGGNQTGLLAADENYDFEYQGVTNLGKTKTVKLGDTLLVECTYNTESRSTLTWGGLSTSDEMCLAFLYYYPAMNLTGCMSFPNLTTLYSEMGTPANTTLWTSMMYNRTWNDTTITQYQQTLKTIDQLALVIDSFGKMSRNTGKIPLLRVLPSEPCMNAADATKLAFLSLLLCLGAHYVVF
ncbi:hypothetical protein DNTS_002195 [Danionella cerebrum]|nr:hypothetical protein DNTS_002195 [Danionella translucida]